MRLRERDTKKEKVSQTMHRYFFFVLAGKGPGRRGRRMKSVDQREKTTVETSSVILTQSIYPLSFFHFTPVPDARVPQKGTTSASSLPPSACVDRQTDICFLRILSSSLFFLLVFPFFFPASIQISSSVFSLSLSLSLSLFKLNRSSQKPMHQRSSRSFPSLLTPPERFPPHHHTEKPGGQAHASPAVGIRGAWRGGYRGGDCGFSCWCSLG